MLLKSVRGNDAGMITNCLNRTFFVHYVVHVSTLAVGRIGLSSENRESIAYAVN